MLRELSIAVLNCLLMRCARSKSLGGSCRRIASSNSAVSKTCVEAMVVPAIRCSSEVQLEESVLVDVCSFEVAVVEVETDGTAAPSSSVNPMSRFNDSHPDNRFTSHEGVTYGLRKLYRPPITIISRSSPTYVNYSPQLPETLRSQ